MSSVSKFCSLLRVNEAKAAFLGGDDATGLERINSLKPAWQHQIFECLSKVAEQAGNLDWGREAMLGQSNTSVTLELKARALALFLSGYAQAKLEKENGDARAFDSTLGLHPGSLDFASVSDRPFPTGPGISNKHYQTFESQLILAEGAVSLPSGLNSREIGSFSIMGRRSNMEDVSIIAQFRLDLRYEPQGVPVELYAVCDGHGGLECADYLKQNLSGFLKQSLENFNREALAQEGIFLSIKEAFLKLDSEFTSINPGATATVAILLKDHLWVANLGDSRTVLCQNGVAIQLTEDQKLVPVKEGCIRLEDQRPARQEDQKLFDKYMKKLIARGGKIEMIQGTINGIKVNVPRVYGGFCTNVEGNRMLAMPRAFGDHSIVAYRTTPPFCRMVPNTECVIVHTPKITQIPLSELNENSALLLACDGVWDVCTSGQAATYVQSKAHENALEVARGIVTKAYNAGSLDNLSALVVRFK